MPQTTPQLTALHIILHLLVVTVSFQAWTIFLLNSMTFKTFKDGGNFVYF
jgi:hypothetical protein